MIARVVECHKCSISRQLCNRALRRLHASPYSLSPREGMKDCWVARLSGASQDTEPEVGVRALDAGRGLGQKSAGDVWIRRSPEVQDRRIPSMATCKDASEVHLGGRRQTSCPGRLIAITVAADTPGGLPG